MLWWKYSYFVVISGYIKLVVIDLFFDHQINLYQIKKIYFFDLIFHAKVPTSVSKLMRPVPAKNVFTFEASIQTSTTSVWEWNEDGNDTFPPRPSTEIIRSTLNESHGQHCPRFQLKQIFCRLFRYTYTYIAHNKVNK